MTKVVAINGSPRMEKGYTARILSPFLEGMRDAGASVELYYAKRLDVEPCAGEFYCWYKKPGACHIDDSMQQLYPRLREADVLVLATPVYVPLPGEMQNLLNRLMPLIKPALRRRGGRTRARLADGAKMKKIVLVSTCGWWEMGNFGTVMRIAKELASDIGVEFAGALLRPHSGQMQGNEEKMEDIIDAARKAGYALEKEGSIPGVLADIVGQPLVTHERFLSD